MYVCMYVYMIYIYIVHMNMCNFHGHIMESSCDTNLEYWLINPPESHWLILTIKTCD